MLYDAGCQGVVVKTNKGNEVNTDEFTDWENDAGKTVVLVQVLSRQVVLRCQCNTMATRRFVTCENLWLFLLETHCKIAKYTKMVKRNSKKWIEVSDLT